MTAQELDQQLPAESIFNLPGLFKAAPIPTPARGACRREAALRCLLAGPPTHSQQQQQPSLLEWAWVCTSCMTCKKLVAGERSVHTQYEPVSDLRGWLEVGVEARVLQHIRVSMLLNQHMEVRSKLAGRNLGTAS